jgi:hypothetical protein
MPNLVYIFTRLKEDATECIELITSGQDLEDALLMTTRCPSTNNLINPSPYSPVK